MLNYEKEKNDDLKTKISKKPWQAILGSPLNPGGHWHRKVPGKLSQMALRPHAGVALTPGGVGAHSSTSTQATLGSPLKPGGQLHL